MADDKIRLRFTPFLHDAHEAMERVTSGLAHRIMHYLCRIRDFKTNSVRVSQGRIADHFGVSTEGVRKALNQLRDVGVLVWGGPHRHAATYALTCLYRKDYRGESNLETGADGRYPTQVGSKVSWYPTQVGSIPCDLNSNIPLTPQQFPHGRLVPDARGGDEMKTNEATSPTVAAERPLALDASSVSDEAGWMTTMEARRVAEKSVRTDSVPSRADAERFVAAAVDDLAEGEALRAGEGPLAAEDASALPLSTKAVPIALRAATGADGFENQSWAASALTRLAATGELTPAMIHAAVTAAVGPDHKIGWTRLVVAAVREVHVGRLSVRRFVRGEARRRARAEEFGDEPPRPRLQWLTTLDPDESLLGDAANIGAYRAAYRRAVIGGKVALPA